MKPYYEVGPHFGKVVRQGLTKAKTGTKQFCLTVKVLGVPSGNGEYDAHTQQHERTIYMALTEKTMPNVVEKLQALRFTGSSLGQLDPSSDRHISFEGQDVDLYCSHELDQQGSPRERWDVSRGATVLTPLTPKETRELDSLFGKALGGVKVQRGVANVVAPELRHPDYESGPQPTDPSDLGITDDDIPF